MPKETIFDTVGCFDVKVGWSRDSYVQIATEMREPDTSERPQNLRELVASWADVGYIPTEGNSSEMGLWATLDRDGINTLIRVLRRARDQAFGRDE